jgi:hypothetical protein
MSIKTLRKRIALVAVSALGVGLLSVAPASATDLTASDVALASSAAGVANAGHCTSTVATAASAALSRPIQVGGTQQFAFSNSADAGRVVISGPAKWQAAPTAGTVGSTGQTLTVTTSADTKAIMEVTGAGTIKVDVYATATSTSSLETFYFTGVSSCVSGVSAAKSFVQVTSSSTKVMTNANFAAATAIASATTNAAGAMDNSTDNDTAFANDGTAYIHINTNDSYSAPYTTSSTLSISCTNNAVVGGTKNGYYVLTSQTAAYYSISVAQPTSGTALKTDCTVSYNGTVLATKSILIVGDLASIKADLFRNGDAEATTTSQYGLIRYYYYDAAGNSLSSTGNLPSLTASTISTKTNLLVTTDGSTAGNSTARDALGVAAGASERSGRVAYNCLDYGNTKVSIKATNASATTITSNVVEVVCGGPTFDYDVALDKASYQTGDIATLTITAKNYGGGAVASNVTLGTGAAAALGGMTAVTTPSTADTLGDMLKGTWTYQFKVGQDVGSFAGSVTVGLGSAYATLSPKYNKPATLKYNIVSSTTSVSNAEVLAAIVKLIASINKQIRALQKSLKR